MSRYFPLFCFLFHCSMTIPLIPVDRVEDILIKEQGRIIRARQASGEVQIVAGHAGKVEVNFPFLCFSVSTEKLMKPWGLKERERGCSRQELSPEERERCCRRRRRHDGRRRGGTCERKERDGRENREREQDGRENREGEASGSGISSEEVVAVAAVDGDEHGRRRAWVAPSCGRGSRVMGGEKTEGSRAELNGKGEFT